MMEDTGVAWSRPGQGEAGGESKIGQRCEHCGKSSTGQRRGGRKPGGAEKTPKGKCALDKEQSHQGVDLVPEFMGRGSS